VSLHKAPQLKLDPLLERGGIDTQIHLPMNGWVLPAGYVSDDGLVVPTPNELPADFTSGMHVGAIYIEKNIKSKFKLYDRARQMTRRGRTRHESWAGYPIIGYMLVQE